VPKGSKRSTAMADMIAATRSICKILSNATLRVAKHLWSEIAKIALKSLDWTALELLLLVLSRDYLAEYPWQRDGYNQNPNARGNRESTEKTEGNCTSLL
jgi:hypothetical protein